MPRHPAIPYVLPFAVFMAMLAVRPHLHFGRWEYPLWLLVLTAILLYFSRHVIDLRVSRPLGTVLLGVGVFVVWIAPDMLIPGYRSHWLFQNAILGHLGSSIASADRIDPLVLTSRFMRAVILVPIIEELFWRGWLMRWLIQPKFWTVPLGSYTAESFWICAALFASEHGSYWEVGLLAGVAYNWWMIRTRSLGDCILAHAITNACLSCFVLVSGRWEYWT